MQRLNKKQLELALYKLLNDVLFLWTIFFGGLLLAEGILPGFVSGYVSFTKAVLAFFAIAVPIGYLGRRNGLSVEWSREKGISHNKLPIALLFAAFLLIANALRGFGAAKVMVISALTLAILFLFYKILIVDEE